MIYTSIASHDFSVAIEIQLDKACPGSEVLPSRLPSYTGLLSIAPSESHRAKCLHNAARQTTRIRRRDEGA